LSLTIYVEFGKERVCVDALCSHQGEHRNSGRNLHGVRRREKKRTVKAAKRIRKGSEGAWVGSGKRSCRMSVMAAVKC
jgi:hypothetical protein